MKRRVFGAAHFLIPESSGSMHEHAPPAGSLRKGAQLENEKFYRRMTAVVLLGAAGYGLYWIGMNRGMNMKNFRLPGLRRRPRRAWQKGFRRTLSGKRALLA